MGDAMQSIFGWWDVDVENARLVNRRTGQRLSYVGRAEDDPSLRLTKSLNWHWMRFDYEDRECRYPLLIEWRKVPKNMQGERPLVWRVDHLRSAALWRREMNRDDMYPPYGLWRRVDDCLCDVFTFWPAMECVSAAPHWIAINGGWLNGRWTEDLYRHFPQIVSNGFVPVNETKIVAWMSDLAAPSPSPWEFVAASGTADRATLSDWGFETSDIGQITLPAGRALTDIGQSRAYLRSADGQKALILLDPRRRKTGLQQSHCLHLLYVDDDIVCDALTTDTGSAVRGPTSRSVAPGAVYADFTFDTAQSRLGEGSCGFTVRHHGAPDSLFLLRLSPSERWLPSPALCQRLTWAVRDAWSVWPGANLTLCNEGGVEKVSIEKPQATLVRISGQFDDAHRVGLPYGTMISATSPIAGVNRFMFDEEYDGVLRVQSRTEIVGWWDFDPTGPALINRKSGQRMNFSGTIDGVQRMRASASRPSPSLRFDYIDNEIRYPLVVAGDMIDHGLSAELWRREANVSAPHPTYGLWKRVDECAMDALLCWPELEATGRRWNSRTSVGAWLNGAWDAGALSWRRCSSSDLLVIKAEQLIADPILEPLNSTPPPIWEFVNALGAPRMAQLAHIEARPGENRILPADAPLTGFEDHMPHLRRADGQAVIVPCWWTPGRSSRPSQVHFIYADSDFFVRVAMTNDREFQLSGLQDYGVRHRDGPVWVAAPDRFKSWERPSYAMWRRLSSALIEGGLRWAGVERPILVSDSGLGMSRMTSKRGGSGNPKEDQPRSLPALSSVAVHGSYVAGRFVLVSSVGAEDGARRAAAERRKSMPDKLHLLLLGDIERMRRERLDAGVSVVFRWGRGSNRV